MGVSSGKYYPPRTAIIYGSKKYKPVDHVPFINSLDCLRAFKFLRIGHVCTNAFSRSNMSISSYLIRRTKRRKAPVKASSCCIFVPYPYTCYRNKLIFFALHFIVPFKCYILYMFAFFCRLVSKKN